MILFVSLALALVIYVSFAIIRSQRYQAKLAKFEDRIHVNGTRGKSTVTRLIAGALREHGVETVAKTTGTAARLILSHREEEPLVRASANVSEQRRAVETVAREHPSVRALVFECMAINPLYQDYLERRIMRSTIGVITNVREDHADMMGATKAEMARSLASTVPKEGHLVTAETNPRLVNILADVAHRRGTELHRVGRDDVSTAELKGFRHFEYKENVAVALRVAELRGIPRETALAGMYAAEPDPGAFQVEFFEHHGVRVHWANLFAVNDETSLLHTVSLLEDVVGTNVPKAVIVNNRVDRPDRVGQFYRIATERIDTKHLIAMGAYSDDILRRSRRSGTPFSRIVDFGERSKAAGLTSVSYLTRLLEEIGEDEVFLIGTTNIHTAGASELRSGIEAVTAAQ